MDDEDTVVHSIPLEHLIASIRRSFFEFSWKSLDMKILLSTL